MMKKLIALLLSVSVAAGISVPCLTQITAYAETTVSSSDESGDIETETETETPAPDEDTSLTEETAAPTATEDYSGVDNPEDEDTEMGGGVTSSNGEAGAAGGLGFFGSKFPDCRGHWAEEIIVKCTENKFLDGYDDGNFYPDNPVTASEFAKIFSAWRGSFYQITEGYWATPYIINMLDDKIFEAGDYSDYDAPMTRAQVAKAVINSLKSEYFPQNLNKYKAMIPDISDVDESYSDYLTKAYMAGIMSGYDDGTIRPNAPVTRAEVLSVIDRAVNPDTRVIPDAVSAAASDTPEMYTFYTAAVQVRRSNNAASMNYRLHSKNSQYMTENDDASGLKMSEETQGVNGFAVLFRYDLTDILKREDKLKSVSLVVNHESWGTADLGLFYNEHKISSTDWNNTAYMQVINNNAVAAADKAGYNAVVDNLMAQLPTWGDAQNAVPADKKTKPFAAAALENGQYIFNLDIKDLKAHMDDSNMVEFYLTTVNYDGYSETEENKPKIYLAGANAPQLFSTFDTDEEVSRTVRLLAESAAIEGGMLNKFGEGEDSYIENFRTDQKITYNFKASLAGRYKMRIYYSANVNSGGGTVTFDLNGSKFDHEFAQTGGWAYYVYEDLGEVNLKAGNNTLILTDKEVPNTYLINVKNIEFEKID